MRYLADVNVVFPLMVSRHQHRAAAIEWFDGTAIDEVALTRLTRLGVLRLLCTSVVMGPDVLAPEVAIEALEILEADERVVLMHEPDGLDGVLKGLVASRTSSPNLWTDAYLAAFAKLAGLTLVSFDRGFSKFEGLDALLLGAALKDASFSGT